MEDKKWPLRALLVTDFVLLGATIYILYTGRSATHRNDFYGLWAVVPLFLMFAVGLLAYVVMLGSTLRYSGHTSVARKFSLIIMLALFSLPVFIGVANFNRAGSLSILFVLTIAIEVCLMPVKKLFAYLLLVSRTIILALVIMRTDILWPHYSSAPMWAIVVTLPLIVANLYPFVKDWLSKT